MFASACLSAWEATTLGVTSKTNADRKKYWPHWTAFTTITQTDPFLDLKTVYDIERDIVVGAFAALRRGIYGRGEKIKVSGVTDVLLAISKTIELAGKPSPLYPKETTYQLVIKRMIEGYCRLDPPSVPQLAVPASLAKTAYKTALLSDNRATKHKGFTHYCCILLPITGRGIYKTSYCGEEWKKDLCDPHETICRSKHRIKKKWESDSSSLTS